MFILRNKSVRLNLCFMFMDDVKGKVLEERECGVSLHEHFSSE